MASARAVITTNRCGCREVVNDSVNGFIVEEKNNKALIARIEQFISLSINQRKEMGLAGRSKIEKEYDRKIVVKNTLRK